MEYLFLLLDLKNRSVLVVGGGDIAARKISLLKRAGAKIKVVAYSLCSELKNMQDNSDIIWIGRTFTETMLDDVFLVIVAINDTSVSDFVYQCAEKYHKFINVVDNQLKCSFIFPAIIDRSPVMVAISSCGKSPVLVRILRERLESLLPNFLGRMANLLGAWRNRVKNHISNVFLRRRFWENILHNNIFTTLIANGLFEQAHCFLANSLDLDNKKKLSEKLVGSVSLVGAGPGDSGLFTLRGLQLIQEADVVLYDCLVSFEILGLIRRDAKKICVGKRATGKVFMGQKDINNIIIRLARKGNKVVRLKGGDPFIFGRGGEELEAIIAAGIPCQVVPGVTSASAVSIYAGIPLTHRNYAHSVVFITGSIFCNISYKEIDFRFLGCPNQTLVIYMGIVHVHQVYTVLVNNGCSISTPVAIISDGTHKSQKVVIGVLNDLEELAIMAHSPSLLIIGNVVALHQKMYWLNYKHMVNSYKFTSLINLF